MCGIAGGWLPAANEAMLDRAARMLAHRGPDGQGRYYDEAAGVALLHARLAIIDLSPAGHQPMLAQDGMVALAFNGEIYNFAELRAGLQHAGIQFRGHSDTEVLLELYLKHGLDALPMLNGIFALAIHDRRSGELLLARDGLGVKPLYVAETGSGLAFSSEIKALLPLIDDSGPLDMDALHRYLTYLWCPGPGTPLQRVRKLPPGVALRFQPGRPSQQWQWYELPARRGVRATLGKNDAISAVRAGLRTAVSRQLVADVPVGAFLSGGLDSSAVVALAREQVPDLQCFTIESSGDEDAGNTSDLPYAREVARHLGVPLQIVQIDATRMAADLERMVWQLDEPLADPAPLNVFYIAQLARGQGVKVLLSGAGGDDLFTGYRRHLALRYEDWWSWLPASGRQALAAVSRRLDQRTGLGRRLGKLLANSGASDDERLVGYFAWAQREDLWSLYTPAMQAAIGEARAEQPMIDFLAGVPEGTSRMERQLALEQHFFLPDHNLSYTDKMSMAVGVEVRVPFLDPELVELASRIPDRYKQRGRTGKWVLKRAMEPYLPHDVIYRPKAGFGAPLRRWMRHDLRDLLGDLLSESSLRRRGLFEPIAVQRLIADNDTGRRDGSYTLLSLMCIEIWCRRFLDKAG